MAANERKKSPGSLLTRHKLLIEALKDPETTKGDVQVLAAISEHMNHAGAAWPGIDKIAEKVGIHRATAIRGTEKLESLGYLTVDRTVGRSNYYQLPDTRRKRATGTRSKDATGMDSSNQSHGCDPTRVIPATNPLQACNPTRSKDDTRTQLLNSASNSVHRTQGASRAVSLETEEQKQERLQIVRESIRSEYQELLEKKPKLAKAWEETKSIRKHIEDLIPTTGKAA